MQRKPKASSGECGCMVGGGGLEAGLAARGLTADDGTTPAASLAPGSCRESREGCLWGWRGVSKARRDCSSQWCRRC